MIWKVQGLTAWPTASVAWQVNVPKSMSVLALNVRTLVSPEVVNWDLGMSTASLEEFMVQRKSRGPPEDE